MRFVCCATAVGIATTRLFTFVRRPDDPLIHPNIRSELEIVEAMSHDSGGARASFRLDQHRQGMHFRYRVCHTPPSHLRSHRRERVAPFWTTCIHRLAIGVRLLTEEAGQPVQHPLAPVLVVRLLLPSTHPRYRSGSRLRNHARILEDGSGHGFACHGISARSDFLFDREITLCLRSTEWIPPTPLFWTYTRAERAAWSDPTVA